MGILDFFRRKPQDDDEARRTRLLQTGRITEGTIFDISTDEVGATTAVFYSYHISGTEYESSQSLNQEQRLRPADYGVGNRVVVRYDPRQPANSTVV